MRIGIAVNAKYLVFIAFLLLQIAGKTLLLSRDTK
jgi:hypothetical protein